MGRNDFTARLGELLGALRDGDVELPSDQCGHLEHLLEQAVDLLESPVEK